MSDEAPAAGAPERGREPIRAQCAPARGREPWALTTAAQLERDLEEFRRWHAGVD